MAIAITSIEMEIITKLVIAVFLGTIIGIEREIHKRPAGIRTHILVCMGATLFTIISALTNVTFIAAGIVTGVGFLGGGIIYHQRNKIVGLTTAAEIWALAAIGLAVGYGYYFAAFATAILILIVLFPLRVLEQKTLRRGRVD